MTSQLATSVQKGLDGYETAVSSLDLETRMIRRTQHRLKVVA